MKSKKLYPLTRRGWRTTEWQFNNSEWNGKLFIDQTEINKVNSIINKIQDKMPTISKGTNVLIDKNSDIPRAKLKEFISDNKAKKVTLMSKADVIFVRRETVKFFQNLTITNVKIVPQAISDKMGGHGQLSYCLENMSNPDTDYLDLEKKCVVESGWTLSSYRNNKVTDQLDFIYSLQNTKATIVYDDCLTKEINKDGIDLDDEIFETLKGMLLSKDDSTFTLGIEMLSNVSLEEGNLFKISLLMNYVYTKTRRFNAMSYYSTKNFKSLLNYLQMNKIRWNQNWDSYGMSMWSRFGNTEYASNIKKFIIDNLNTKFNTVTGGEAAEIVDIVFK